MVKIKYFTSLENLEIALEFTLQPYVFHQFPSHGPYRTRPVDKSDEILTHSSHNCWFITRYLPNNGESETLHPFIRKMTFKKLPPLNSGVVVLQLKLRVSLMRLPIRKWYLYPSSFPACSGVKMRQVKGFSSTWDGRWCM